MLALCHLAQLVWEERVCQVRKMQVEGRQREEGVEGAKDIKVVLKVAIDSSRAV